MMLKKLILTVLLLTILSFILWHFTYRSYDRNLDRVYLTIDSKSLKKLNKFRDIATEKGVLQRSKNDFVNVNVQYLDDSCSGKIRLKGDWVDHLKDNKWSFRVKLNTKLSDGLSTFSLQNPSTRGYLEGYVYQKLLQKNGILSNEIRFVEVFLNKKSWGVYILEEHLSQRMMSSQNKPAGIILKFDDSEYFKIASKKESTVGLIKKAKIKTYGLSNDSSQIERAKKILLNYQFQVDDLYSNFDSKATGLYYALCDLAVAYHAMGLINLRFYYNFKTEKMELIGYDAYPAIDWGKPYLGAELENFQERKFDAKSIIYSALKDSSIKHEYYKALNQITDSLYIQEFFDEEIELINYYETQIQTENYFYNYDKNVIFDNARAIRSKLPQ